jgi:tagatose 1,6-diphosphate aldolase
MSTAAAPIRTAAQEIARARALDQLAGPDGVVVGAAVDHRDSLRSMLERRGVPAPDDAGMARLKARVAAALAPAASMLLLDVEHGAGAAIAAGALPGTTALCVPLEAQGYGGLHEVAQTTLLPGWSPAAARRLGAVGCKLLLPYRVDAPEQAARQDAVVAACVRACREAGPLLLLEPIAYPRPGAPDPPERFAELVVEGARRLAALGPDVLKVQYPGSVEACQALDEAVGREIPWVLLGGGADAESVMAQVEQASRAGASGFIVGRTLFDGALVGDEEAGQRWLDEVGRPLLERLGELARGLATPWRERLGAPAAPPGGRYDGR